MPRDQGFTVAELLAALLILSLVTLFVGDLIRHVSSSWSDARDRIDRLDSLSRLAAQIDAAETLSPSDAAQSSLPALRTDSGARLALADPKIDQTADCVFDLVGRRGR